MKEIINLKEKKYIVVSGEQPDQETSHAILLCSGKYVLQLRSNCPTISAPNQWSFFGGQKKRGETSIETMRREIFEELAIVPTKLSRLWVTDYLDPYLSLIVRTTFFWSDITDRWPNCRLNEGQAVKAFSFKGLSKITLPSITKITIERFQKQHSKG